MKGVKPAIAAIITVIFLGISGIGFDLYNAQKHVGDTEESVSKLQKEIDTANETAEKTAYDAKNKETPIPKVTSESIFVETESPEAESIHTEFDDGNHYFDLDGKFIEIGSGRVVITVMSYDVGASDEYIISIEGSGRASSSSKWDLVGKWDKDRHGIVYNGTRTDTEINPGGTRNYTTYENQTGLLRYDDDGPITVYWTDPGSGNENRGPFTSISDSADAYLADTYNGDENYNYSQQESSPTEQSSYTRDEIYSTTQDDKSSEIMEYDITGLWEPMTEYTEGMMKVSKDGSIYKFTLMLLDDTSDSVKVWYLQSEGYDKSKGGYCYSGQYGTVSVEYADTGRFDIISNNYKGVLKYDSSTDTFWWDAGSSGGLPVFWLKHISS